LGYEFGRKLQTKINDYHGDRGARTVDGHGKTKSSGHGRSSDGVRVMKLILFRHGIAVDRDEFIAKNQEDSLRPLTEKGRERAKAMAKKLREIEPQVDLIISSPFVRAMQTAEIIFQAYKKIEIVESSELVPSSPPQAFATWLEKHIKMETSVIVVGHEPHLSTFATWTLAGSVNSFLDLKKSGIVCLEVESLAEVGPRTAELKGLLQPKHVLD
jgi:phosphohistidine phosphatase